MFWGKEPTGDNITQGPLWVRPYSLKRDMVENFIHIVGHTRVDEIIISPSIINIDCLENKQYLIHDKKLQVCSL